METILAKPRTLNEVTTDRINEKIAKSQTAAIQALNRLALEGTISRDFIAPIGITQKDKIPVVTFSANGHVQMLLQPEPNTSMPYQAYQLHIHAIEQLAEKMDISAQYLRKLAGGDEWQRRLASHILNEHTGWTRRTRVLVRAVGDQVRGVLSENYKRLNSALIVQQFITTAEGCGGILVDGHMDDTKLFLETLSPFPVHLDTGKNGIVSVAFGARISTSDYGDGKLEMRAFMLNGICLNGMVRESVLQEIHRAGKISKDLAVSEKTYELQTLATASEIDDYTRLVYQPEYIRRKMGEIYAASATDVDVEKEITLLTKSSRLLKDEGEGIGHLLMQNNPNDGIQGESTLWKFTQGITAYARTANPLRQRELQEIAGSLMDRIKTT